MHKIPVSVSPSGATLGPLFVCRLSSHQGTLCLRRHVVAQLRLLAGLALIWVAVVAQSSVAWAADNMQPVPRMMGLVNDRAGVMNPSERLHCGDVLHQVKNQLGVQMAVLTVAALSGEPIEDFSMRVAEAWQLGKKNQDLGLLLVVAPNDHQVRIEVGYGLEGVISDAVASSILSRTMHAPSGKVDLGQAVMKTIDALSDVIAAHRQGLTAGTSAELSPSPKDRAMQHILGTTLVAAALLWLTVGRRLMARVPYRPIHRTHEEPPAAHRHVARSVLSSLAWLALLGGGRSKGQGDDDERGGGGQFGGGGSSGRF